MALLGGLLLCGGTVSLAAGLGLFGGPAARAAIADTPDLIGRPEPWTGWVVAALLVILALLALRWLLVQLRTDAVARVVLGDRDAGGRTELDAKAARTAFEDQVRGLPGVRRAHAAVTESPVRPHLRLDITVDEDSDVADVWRRVRAEALRDMRTALELDRLPAVVRLSMAAPPRDRRHRPA
nr:alkaline shock response membrane anchor protein AmaP [Nocardiopsis mwathae]